MANSLSSRHHHHLLMVIISSFVLQTTTAYSFNLIKSSSIQRIHRNLSSLSSRGNQAFTTTPSSRTLQMSSSSTSNVDVASNLQEVNEIIKNCVEECNIKPESVKLVAVSKTKPIELLMDAYNAGQRHFGENYAQELISKASTLPNDIKWHFIGPLQSNKASSLVKSVGLDKLACIETVSTTKLATKLHNAVDSLLKEEEGEVLNKQLGIYIQINTSGEESKSGIQTEDELKDLLSSIASDCNNLKVKGLMTIGAPGDYSCFDRLVEFRQVATDALGLNNIEELDLSMGMSGDFVEAIKRGSTSVRVGSTIFGARDYSNKK